MADAVIMQRLLEPRAAPVRQIPPELASNLPVVHRVLLADPSEIASLTLSGEPRMLQTPSYEEFESSLNESNQSSSELIDIATTLKKAFCDQLCEKMRDEKSIKAFQELLLELHQQLRALVPSRKDLHGALNDAAVNDTQTIHELFPLVIQAARALSLLESASRAESTEEWIAKSLRRISQLDKISDVSLVTSILYLLHKAELCSLDKLDFYFSHFWAPQLVRMGPELERAAFEEKFGKFSQVDSAPATKIWLKSIHNIPLSSKTQHQIVKEAWVNDILFRNKDADSIPLPEIFYLDQAGIQSIRMVVQMAVAGSALALHACQAAGQSATILTLKADPLSPLESRRLSLVQAMGDRFKRDTWYKRDITDAVLALAAHWNPNIDAATVDSLRRRVTKVLEGDDPVIDLLNKRMKLCFTDLFTATTAFAPLELRTGISIPSTNDLKPPSRKGAFMTQAVELFCSKGIAFFSSDLAMAAWTALRVIEVAIALYEEQLLRPALNST